MPRFRPADIRFFDEAWRDAGDYTFNDLPSDGVTVIHHRIRWIHIFGADLECRDYAEEMVTRRHGIQQEHSERLHSTIKAAFGAAFLGQLESKVEAEISRSITLSKEEAETRTFRLNAFDCYKTSVNVYQLQSELEISCEWKSLLGAKDNYWREKVLVNHNRYAVEKGRLEPAYEVCGCEQPYDDPVVELDVESEHLSVREAALLRNRLLTLLTFGIAVEQGHVKTLSASDHPVHWPPRDGPPQEWGIDPEEAMDEQTEPLLMADLPFPATVLPEYLRFLTRIDSDQSLILRFEANQFADLVG